MSGVCWPNIAFYAACWIILAFEVLAQPRPVQNNHAAAAFAAAATIQPNVERCQIAKAVKAMTMNEKSNSFTDCTPHPRFRGTVGSRVGSGDVFGFGAFVVSFFAGG